MKILVTGCSGRVGVFATRHLCDEGMDVVGIDVTGDPDPRVDYRQCDLMGFDALVPHFEGVDAVLHLAAWATPRVAKPQDVFALNDAGAFNVYQACVQHGINRVVAASSINAIGFFFGTEGFPLTYLPADEEHPCFTTDPYSFSKQILEEIGRYFWRREGITSTSLRFGAGLRPVDEIIERQGAGYRESRALILQLLDLPPAERRREADRMQAAYDASRKRRPFEEGTPWEGLTEAEVRVMNLVHNHFTFVDLNDAAVGIRLALTSEYDGSHPLLITDRYNTVGVEAQDLADLFYPGVPIRRDMDGPLCMAGWWKAKDLIGYEAGISIRDHYRTLFGV